ncbi:anthranilate phosphoribosyltransferase [Marinigracilibium pacificum]|uniref:Anthranilate phosphoribosyltransferase n=1 Tax=Marinigracilibium pacificum TaxID=2729599 RepID=A0A848J872_9BACT|nr:anthranilate phosphoribosyltransferase [Marinigracilibium pacificum]NMM50624.1 anthranilate phosphoribosyltransferase [Marinigracilibium pacificum]
MKEILNTLFEYKTLTEEQAKTVLMNLAGGKYNAAQMASFLTVYMMRSITVEELSGFRKAMMELCVPIDLSEFDAIDLCGTGGDGKNTFNISTLSSFVVAGAGVKVAKHGNNGVSSACGSSNLLAHLGYEFTNDESTLKKQIDETGICFLHAPLFHPAMKNVAPVRKDLGVKTFFNMLGPMVNPASPSKQLTGVFSLELARLYAYLFQQTDRDFVVLHALDGYDEISLTGDFKAITNVGESIFSPKDLGLEKVSADQIYGGETVESSAKIFIDILEGKGTKAQQEVVLANSAMALKCADKTLSAEDAVGLAKESLESGKAYSVLKKLVA